MLLEVIKNIPYWLPIAFVYLLFGGIVALKPRTVWLPLALMVPLFFIGMQYSLFLSISHEYQLIALLALLGGLGFGGTVVRPTILATKPGLQFDVAGEKVTLSLVVIIFSTKLLAALLLVLLPSMGDGISCVSAVIGAFIPGAFLGRALFLTTSMRKKPI